MSEFRFRLGQIVVSKVGMAISDMIRAQGDKSCPSPMIVLERRLCDTQCGSANDYVCRGIHGETVALTELELASIMDWEPKPIAKKE